MKRAASPPRPAYSKAILDLREAWSLTQAQLAARLGVKANTVARWEYGLREPDLWNYWALSAFAGVDPTTEELAGFFLSQAEKLDEAAKWDRRHLLRNLSAFRARASAGDTSAAALLRAASEHRDRYLRQALKGVEALWLGYFKVHRIEPPHGEPPDKSFTDLMRELASVDLLRSGLAIEKLDTEEKALNKRRRQIREGRQEIFLRLDTFRAQWRKVGQVIHDTESRPFLGAHTLRHQHRQLLVAFGLKNKEEAEDEQSVDHQGGR